MTNQEILIYVLVHQSGNIHFLVILIRGLRVSCCVRYGTFYNLSANAAQLPPAFIVGSYAHLPHTIYSALLTEFSK
jgi:hypothetical protein